MRISDWFPIFGLRDYAREGRLPWAETPLQEARLLFMEAFDRRTEISAVDWALVRQVRPRYGAILERLPAAPEAVVGLYSECAELVPNSPTRRRKNEFLAVTGRPLENAFRGRPVDSISAIEQSQDALNRAADTCVAAAGDARLAGALCANVTETNARLLLV